MTDQADLGSDLDEVVGVASEESGKRGRRRSLLLILLLLLLLCCISTWIDVWVERSPDEREFITRNLDCLQCHTELIPDLGRSAVHDPFLREDCTICHTSHGSEVTERISAGGWKRWEQFSTVIEWLPLKIACEVFETPATATDAENGGQVISETTRRTKGDESVLVADKTELCWICHGDLAMDKLPMPNQHAPFDRGFCTDCHNPHASDVRVLLKREERDLCPSCHPMFDELARNQLHPPYEGRFCTNCHDPHASEWTGILIDNQRDLCFICHGSVAPLSQKAVQHNPFLQDNCTGCHEPHAADAMPLLIADQPVLCYDCHPQIEYDFRQPSSHPVGGIQLICSDCHNPHAADYRALLAARDNDMCYECHEDAVGDSRGIFVTYEASAHEGTLCISCHTPHGSPFAPILRDANPDLCLDCHEAAVAGPNRHPFRPTYYDVVAENGLTCTSTCHEPHGTDYNYMLIGWYYPQDGLCLQCHTRVGIDF